MAPDRALCRPSLAGVPPHLVGDGFLADNPEIAAEVWASLSPGLSEEEQRTLGQCVFALLKPDALVAGKAAEVFERLGAAGFEAVYVRPCFDAGPRHYEDLYKFNLTLRNAQNMIGAWWLTSRVFDLGPSIALLLVAPPDADAYGRMKRAKGPADPYAGRPGQLRHDLNAANVAVNLVHSADDALSSAREFRIFDGHDALREALERARMRLQGDGVDLTAALEGALLAVNAPRLDLDPVTCLVAVKVRLLCASGAGDEVCANLARVAAEPGSPHERWNRFRRACAQEQAALRHDAGGILGRLARPDEYEHALAEDVVRELRRLGLPYQPWEALVVETTLFYADRLPRGGAS